MGVGSSIILKKLICYPESLEASKNKEIAKQQKKSLCQIITKKLNANGFLCKIKDVKNPVLITNNHVLGEAQIKPGKEINIYFTDEKDVKHKKTIKIDETRTTYTVGEIDGEDIDVTIIELKQDVDKLNDLEFLEIDKEIMIEKVQNAYKAESVYVIQYKGGKVLAKSLGIIKDVIKINKSYSLYHTCDTDDGSSGSPIILYNHKVIGVHRGGVDDLNLNVGTLLQYPIKEYCGKLKKKNKLNV